MPTQCANNALICSKLTTPNAGKEIHVFAEQYGRLKLLIVPTDSRDMLVLLVKPIGPCLFRTAVLICITLLITASCAATPDRPLPNGPSPSGQPLSLPPEPAGIHRASLKQRLHTMVDTWKGTPHRMGGNDKRGIDCSGFTARIYKEMFDIQLPRATAAQVKTGKPVSTRDLRIADLIFFRPPQKLRHVGIYLGDRQFAHASTSRGVTISSLDNPYWRNAYWTARRILSAH